MSSGVCISCGAALFPDRFAVGGLDFCRACLAPRPAPRRPGEQYPPLWWGAAIGGALLGAIVVGGVLGHAVEVGLGAGSFGLSGAGLGAAIGVAILAVRLPLVIELLDRRWKRKTAAHLGLAHVPLDCFAFAVFLVSRHCPEPEDVGLIAETEDALVFIGRRGGMTMVRLSSVRYGITPDGFCGAQWARLGLGDDSRRWILIREQGETAWARNAATAAFADRVITKLMQPRLRIPRWEEAVGRQAGALAGLRAATVPEQLDNLSKLAWVLPPDANSTRNELDEPARQLVAMALSLLLVDRGWAFASYGPGQTDLLTKDGVGLNPYALLQNLANKELSAQEWRNTWTRAGVAEVDLGEFAASMTKARRKPEDGSRVNSQSY